MGLKTGKFRKRIISPLRRKKKSPIDEKGLFRAIKTFSESQFHAGIELDASDGIIVEKLIFLMRHIV